MRSGFIAFRYILVLFFGGTLEVSKIFQPGLIPLEDLYSTEFTQWLRRFMNTGAVPLGPAHLLSSPNSYMVAPYTNGSHVVLMDENGTVRTFFNACPHRRKVLFKIPSADNWKPSAFMGKIKGGLIFCAGHSWSFTNTGAQGPKSLGCAGLTSAGITRDIGGILWAGSESELLRVESIFALPLMQEHGITTFVPEGYRLHQIKVDWAKYFPCTGIKVYGEVDHIAHKVHIRTLRRVTNVGGLKIDVSSQSDSVSVQMVPWNTHCDAEGTDVSWWKWHSEDLRMREESCAETTPRRIDWFQESRSGWTGERFPSMYVDSRFLPDPDSNGTVNIIGFYFHKDVLDFRSPVNDTDEFGDVVHFAVKAYLKLAAEDAELCEEEDQGSRILVSHGNGHLVDGVYKEHEEGVSYQYERWLAKHWNEYRSKK